MRVLAVLLLLFAFHAADAQVPVDAAAVRRGAPDLQYPQQPSTLSVFSGPQMALYKPSGDGPFPALVIAHQCGGLRSPAGWQNMSILQWARTAVDHGYVALVIDSLGPRNAETVCNGPRNGVTLQRGARDVLLAGAHLATLPYVDPARIAVTGFSWGAMASVLASSRAWATALGDGFRFRAAAAFYPGCFTLPVRGGSFDVLNTDVDRPLLVLMGGQDTETPAALCTPRLQQLQADGAPVQFHLYPDVTHCWDYRNLDNFRKVSPRGAQVVYHYDEAVTRDSAQRLFDFLAQAMPHG